MSKGKWIAVCIELSDGYDVSNIDNFTLTPNGTIQVEHGSIVIKDYDGDGVLDLMVKFDRQTLMDFISANVSLTQLYREEIMTIALTIHGGLNDETPFQGSSTIRIIVMPTPMEPFQILPI